MSMPSGTGMGSYSGIPLSLALLANGIIYGLADDGLSAWRAANGHFLWRNPHYQLNGRPQSLVVTDGKVYITNFYPEVDVLDVSSGHFLHSIRPLNLAIPELWSTISLPVRTQCLSLEDRPSPLTEPATASRSGIARFPLVLATCTRLNSME